MPGQKRRAFPRKPVYIIGILLLGLLTGAFLVMLILTDILPPDITVILAAAAVALLLFTNFMISSRYRWKRIIGIVLCIVAVGTMGFVTNFMRETYGMLNKISASAVDATGPSAKKVNITEEPFNVYITGIDQWESEKGLDLERSDVNMIMTINPRTKKILLTSIPRDSYVKLHTAQQMDKLTHTGIYGVDETINTVQDWLGTDLNYYVKMNFSGAKDIINAMNGIKVYSPVAFESSLKPYKYIKAVIKKMTSSTTLLTSYGDIMDAAGQNLSTNMSAEDMTELAKMQISELSTWDVETQKIDGEYDEDYVASLTQAQKFSVYRPDPASVSKCVEGIEKIMNPPASELEAADKNRSKSFIVNMVNKAIESIDNKINN